MAEPPIEKGVMDGLPVLNRTHPEHPSLEPNSGTGHVVHVLVSRNDVSISTP